MGRNYGERDNENTAIEEAKGPQGKMDVWREMLTDVYLLMLDVFKAG